MKQIILTIAAILLLTSSVIACSCIYLPDAESKMKNANVVFSGKVINLQESEGNFRAEFQVYEYWKMENDFLLEDKLIVNSVESTGANCGLNFIEG